MIPTRGLGRNGTAAALLVTLGLGIATPTVDTVEPYYGDATGAETGGAAGLTLVTRVDVETGAVVGIFVIGRTELVPLNGGVSISMAGDALGAERLGYASIESVPVAEVDDPELATVVT